MLTLGDVAQRDEQALTVLADAHVAHLIGQNTSAENAIAQPVDGGGNVGEQDFTEMQ